MPEGRTHEIVRVRHEARRRKLVVQKAEFLTPGMLRLRLGGEELAQFTSLAPDDHIKLFVPGANGDVEKRDYTPRRYDPASGELIVDVVLHDAGPVTEWARQARPGDAIEIGGPRGSAVIPADFDWWLLVGDETALPAIGRRVEELPAQVPVTSIVAVTGPDEEQQFASQANHRAIWIHRPPDRADDPAPFVDSLEQLTLPAGDGFVWIAAEAGVARAVRRHVTDIMGHPVQWLKASGYWAKGKVDAHESIRA